MLKLEVRKSPLITELRCSGRIVQGDGADTLLRAVVSECTAHILIELFGVKAIDAAGLGALAELERWARDGNRTVYLVNPSTRVREVLEITRLSSVLLICSTLVDASPHTSSWLQVKPPCEFEVFSAVPSR